MIHERTITITDPYMILGVIIVTIGILIAIIMMERMRKQE
jgi:hypothetical protein